MLAILVMHGHLDFFFSSRRRHTRWNCDWSSDVCSSDLCFAVFKICAECVEERFDVSLALNDIVQHVLVDLLRNEAVVDQLEFAGCERIKLSSGRLPLPQLLEFLLVVVDLQVALFRGN